MPLPDEALTCRQCDAPLRSKARFCTVCGSPATQPSPAKLQPPPAVAVGDSLQWTSGSAGVWGALDHGLRTGPAAPPPPPHADTGASSSGIEPEPADLISDDQVDVHSSYRSGRMGHEPPDELTNSQVTLRTLRPHLLRSVSFLAAFLVVLPFWLALVFFSTADRIAGTLTRQPETSGTDSLGALTTLAGVALLIIFASWLISLFFPVREPISEYGLLIENRAPAAAEAFDWISRTVAGRHLPLVVAEVTVEGQQLLTLRNVWERSAVVVTPYGVDLYLGWTMWRERSTVRILLHVIRDMFENASGGSYTNDLRIARTRAFREVVHSVTREGAQAAISHSQGPI